MMQERKVRAHLALLPIVLIASTSFAQDIAGDWHGTLNAGAAELRLVLHITKDKTGAFRSTIDSVDQGANGIPVSSTTLQGSKLKLAVDSINASYEGEVNSANNVITGTWNQGQALPLEFSRGGPDVGHIPADKPSDIDGTWSGRLDFGATKLRIVFHIVNTTDGLMATADSPDQGAKGMPVTSVTRNGTSLKIEMKALAAVFEGSIASDLQSIAGTFTQNGTPVPSTLTRVKD